MNPNFNWAIVAERMQTLQAEADTAARARHAAGSGVGRPPRLARRSRRGLAFARPARAVAPGHHPRNHHQDSGGTVKYMMLVCADEAIELSPEEGAQIGPGDRGLGRGDGPPGIRLQGDQLRPVSDATTVSVRGGEVLIADGPFAETKEQIAGFDILECADLDEAIEVASKHPVARFGKLEVRPFWAE